MPDMLCQLVACIFAGIAHLALAFCAPHNIVGNSTAVLTPSGVSSLYLIGRAALARPFFYLAGKCRSRPQPDGQRADLFDQGFKLLFQPLCSGQKLDRCLIHVQAAIHFDL